MSDYALEPVLTRIAVALEKQNDMYKRVAEKNDARYEAHIKDKGIHDDLVRQIVSLNGRLAEMSNTIDRQNAMITDQESAILALREGRGRFRLPQTAPWARKPLTNDET